MKKRIVALIGALSLTFAMGLNVCAAGSVTADNVADAVVDIPSVEVKDDKVVVTAGGITAEIDIDEMEKESDNVNAAFSDAYDWENYDPQTVVYANAITKVDSVVKVAEAVAVELAAPSVLTDKVITGVVDNKVIAVELISSWAADSSKPIVVTLDVYKLGLGVPGEGEVILATNADVKKTFAGEYKDGRVTFTLDHFSPFAIYKVKTENKPQSNGGSNGGSNAPAQDTTMDAAAMHQAVWNAWLASGGNIPVIATAPKTGDLVAVVGVMAVIFLGGAATAVAMSKKRA